MTTTKDKAVFCIADTRDKAINIVNTLRTSGFQPSDISLVAPHLDDDGEIGVEGGNKAAEGASTGAGGGMLLGGVVGWMVGIGALAIPGLGPFIAAGPIMAALSGAALGSAAGGITGALIGMGFSEYEAKQYETYVNDGNALISVAVCTDDEVDRVKDIFDNAEADHISVQSVVEAQQS